MNQESDKTNQGRSMLKNCLRSLFLLLFPLLSLAQNGPLTYEDFVHLSEKDQDRFVVKTMELMVRLENTYRKDPRSLHLSEEDEKKFTQFFNKLKSILSIDEAYAYEGNYYADQEWKSTANGFVELISKDVNLKKCVFAGWISRASTENNRTVCSHPQNVGTGSREGEIYLKPKPASNCEASSNKIQCNPVIFGYKSIKNKEPICVSTDNHAVNSSFDCMQAALGIKKIEGADSKEDRLNFLKDRLKDNPTVFKSVHEFNYKMCVCDIEKEKPIPADFSKNYLLKIQLTQTCYGLMNMIGETASMCSPGNMSAGMDLSFFKNLTTHIQTMSDRHSIIGANDFGLWYQSYVTNLRKQENRTPEYARLCGGAPAPRPEPPKPWKCSGTCKIEGDKLNCDLSVKKPDGSSIPPKSYPFDKSDFIGTDNILLPGKNIEISVEENNSAKLVCDVTIDSPIPPQPQNDWPKYTCEAKCAPQAMPLAGKSCEVKITTFPRPPVKTTEEIRKVELKPGESLNIKDPTGKPLQCSITPVTPEPQPKPKDPATCKAKNCVANNQPNEGSKTCDLEITSKVNDKEETTKVEKAVIDKEGKYTHKEEKLTCVIEEPKKEDEDEDDSKLPTLNVTATEKDAKSYNVKATITDKGDWTFGWVVKASSGTETPEVTKDWEDKSGTPPAGVPNDDSAPTAPGSKEEFVQQRAKVDFNLCGQLTKQGQTTIEKCALIKKYVEENKPVTNPTTQNGQTIVPPPPQPMIRNSSDTGAVGIR